MAGACCQKVAGLVEVHALLHWSGCGQVSRWGTMQLQHSNVLLISLLYPVATRTVSHLSTHHEETYPGSGSEGVKSRDHVIWSEGFGHRWALEAYWKGDDFMEP